MISNCIVVNQGNTSTKWGVFTNGQLTATYRTFNEKEEEAIVGELSDHNLPFFGISVCDTVKQEKLFGQLQNFQRIRRSIMPAAHYSEGLPGEDRLTNLVGASMCFPGENYLVVDFGTCITYSLGHSTELIGGAISPGLNTRLKSMHEHTGNLPRLDFSMPSEVFANSTASAMLSGVYNGIIGEIKLFIEKTQLGYPHINVVFTGSDAAYFAEPLEYRIFVEEKLTLFGIYALAQRNNLSI